MGRCSGHHDRGAAVGARGTVREIDASDRDRFAELLRAGWGSSRMVSRGRIFDVLDHAGFLAESGGDWLGYATYEVVGDELEVTVLESVATERGVGSALLAACVAVALRGDLGRVCLVTTNDNVHALRFYQRRGFAMAALHRDAVTDARHTLKPEIPLLGVDDIPLRDELELELPRTDWEAMVARYGWA